MPQTPRRHGVSSRYDFWRDVAAHLLKNTQVLTASAREHQIHPETLAGKTKAGGLRPEAHMVTKEG